MSNGGSISSSGLIFTQNGNEFTTSGSLTAINNGLEDGITYAPTVGGTTNTLTLSVTDGSDTAFRTIGINTSIAGSPTTTNVSMSGEITNADLIDIAGTTTLSSDALFNSGGTVKIEAGELLQLDDTKIYSGTITDNGTVEISGLDALSSSAHLNIGAGNQLTIDPTATLVINGATITGGTINDGTSGSGGTIDVLGSSAITGASLNNGGVAIASGETLTLNDTTVTGSTITDLSTTTTTGIVNVDSGKTLTLAGSDTITGGLFGNPLPAPCRRPRAIPCSFRSCN